MQCAAGAGYFEMAAAVAHTLLQGNPAGAAMISTVISSPLILQSPSSQSESGGIILTATVNCSTGSCDLLTGTTKHVSTHFSRLTGADSASKELSPEPMLARCSEPIAATYVYGRLAAAGLQYGPAFRRLRCIKQGSASAAAKVRQPDSMAHAGFILNPAVLDSCLQLGGMVPQHAAAQGGTYIPATLAALQLGSHLGSDAAVALAQRPAGTSDSDAELLRDHMLVGVTGQIICKLSGLASKSTGGRAKAAVDTASDVQYVISWEASAALSSPLHATLGLEDMQMQLATGSSLGVAAAGLGVVKAALATGAAGLQLQTSGQRGNLTAIAGHAASAAGGQLWGMMRTVAQECPSLGAAGMDTDRLAAGSAAVIAQMQLPSSTNEPASFDGYGSSSSGRAQYLPVMQHSTTKSTPQPFQLLPMPRGAVTNMAPHPVNVDQLQPGEVIVEVKAVGINFRQVQCQEISCLNPLLGRCLYRSCPRSILAGTSSTCWACILGTLDRPAATAPA